MHKTVSNPFLGPYLDCGLLVDDPAGDSKAAPAVKKQVNHQSVFNILA